MLFAAILLVAVATLSSPWTRELGAMNPTTLSLKNQDEMISYINRVQSSWTAGKNFPDHTSEAYLRRLASARRPKFDELPRLMSGNDLEKKSNDTDDKLPEEFDPRKKWPDCPTISRVWDQGNCGSCWAVSTAGVISDRICIATKGAFKGQVSAHEILACCVEHKCGDGCDGGFENKALQFYVKHGLATGGDFDSKEGCMPYEIKPCSHHVVGRYPNCHSYNETVVPTCKKQCSNTGYKIALEKDRQFGKHAYEVKVAKLKKELSEKGPVTSAFMVYEDFYHYKSGVYHHVKGKEIGLHAVRVLGYGKENGVDYWLVANSWNTDWGDKGLFKIRRGTNESGFEDWFWSAEPKLKKEVKLLHEKPLLTVLDTNI